MSTDPDLQVDPGWAAIFGGSSSGMSPRIDTPKTYPESNASPTDAVLPALTFTASTQPDAPAKDYFGRVENDAHHCRIALQLQQFSPGEHAFVGLNTASSVSVSHADRPTGSVRAAIKEHQLRRLQSVTANKSLTSSSLGVFSSSSFTSRSSDADAKAKSKVFLPVAMSEWSIAEDKLLLQMTATQSDPVTGYIAAHRSNPQLYPKPVTPNENCGIPERIEELRSRGGGERAAIIDRFARLDGQVDSHDGASQHSMTPQEQSLLAPDNAAASTAAVNGGSLRVGGPTMRNSGQSSEPPDVVLRCVTREDAKRAALLKEHAESIAAEGEGEDWSGLPKSEGSNVYASSKSILRHSAYLSELFARYATTVGDASMARKGRAASTTSSSLGERSQSTRPRGSSFVMPSELPCIVLSEAESMYSSVGDMHRVFGEDNVQRYAAFCSQPNLIDKKCDAAETLDTAVKEEGRVWETFERTMDEDQSLRLNFLTEYFGMEDRHLTDQVQEWFNEDVQLLKRLYDGHLFREREKLRERERVEVEETSAFYRREKQALSLLRARDEEDKKLAKLRVEASTLERRCNELFPRQGITRLLLLSELLLSNQLRDSCCREIAANCQLYATDSVLQSTLISPSTIQSILTQVSLRDIFGLVRKARAEKGPATLSAQGFPLNLLEEEFNQRKATKREALQRLPYTELRALADELLRVRKQQQRQAAADRQAQNEGKGSQGTTPIRRGSMIRRRSSITTTQNNPSSEKDAAMSSAVSEEDMLWFDLVFDVAAERDRRTSRDGGGSSSPGPMSPASPSGQVSKTPITAQGLKVFGGKVERSAVALSCDVREPHKRVIQLLEPFRYATITASASEFPSHAAETRRCGESTLRLYFEVYIRSCDAESTPFLGVGYEAALGSCETEQDAESAVSPGNSPTKASPPAKDRSSRRQMMDDIKSLLLSAKEGAENKASRRFLPGLDSGDPQAPGTGFLWTNNGSLYLNGAIHNVGKEGAFQAGDTVGLALEELTGSVLLFRNHKVVQSSEKLLRGVLLGRGPCAPVVCLHSSFPDNFRESMQHAHNQADEWARLHGVAGTSGGVGGALAPTVVLNADGPFSSIAGIPRELVGYQPYGKAIAAL